ncbi:HPr-rel-A system PqqD family peptide chaperone [Parasphingorhabdus sp. DH2-15]|uniref:HPr-rel-A system PqqD family peptide chaperone n=1 Tax=Parasphingorhabdus sp. DH2-15 TaxID=3444112 RepID=UPI003F684577
MTAMHYMIDPSSEWQKVSLDEMDVLFHRPSGQTHILIEPAPQIFDCLIEGATTLQSIHDRLASLYTYELEDVDGEVLTGESTDETVSVYQVLEERLEEMVALGFVHYAEHKPENG